MCSMTSGRPPDGCDGKRREGEEFPKREREKKADFETPLLICPFFVDGVVYTLKKAPYRGCCMSTCVLSVLLGFLNRKNKRKGVNPLSCKKPKKSELAGTVKSPHVRLPFCPQPSSSCSPSTFLSSVLHAIPRNYR